MLKMNYQRGGFSVVYEANNQTGERFAIKKVRKDKLQQIDLIHLRRETQILQTIQHPNIIKLYDVHENERELFFVMELVSGGLDLFDRICERGKYSEKVI